MTQGLLLYDSSAGLIVCNERYLAMYGLSREVVKPGLSLRDLGLHRKEMGTFRGDVDEYLAAVMMMSLLPGGVFKRLSGSLRVLAKTGHVSALAEHRGAHAPWR